MYLGRVFSFPNGFLESPFTLAPPAFVASELVPAPGGMVAVAGSLCKVSVAASGFWGAGLFTARAV
jgi:hypothetical protein